MIKYWSILFALILVSPSVISQSIIIGKINNYDGKSEIYYSNSWEGIHPLIGQFIKPNYEGKFKINLNQDKLGKVNMSYKEFRTTLFYTDNSKIEIIIDQNNPTIFSLHGDLAAINKYYHSFSSSMNSPFISVSGNGHSRFIASLDAPKLVVNAIDSMIQRDINLINAEKLVDLEGLDQIIFLDVKEHLINEIKAYYGAVFLNAMLLKKQIQSVEIKKNEPDTLKIYNGKWQKLIESFSYNITQEITPDPNSPYYNELLRMHSYIFKTYKEYDFPQPMSMDEDIYNKLVDFDSLLFNDNKSILAYQLGYLNLFLASDFYYSPALLDITNQLKSENPDLPYWQFLDNNIRKLKGSILANDKDYKEAKILKLNYTSFKDLLKQFSGKYLYVDIWATWCLPCIKDFQYKNEINSILETEVERLYISIDQQRFEERWKQSIKYNELEGYHVRANNDLIKDMWTVIGGIPGAIPRYLLINKSGKIFKSTAASPQDSQELEKQVNEMLTANEMNE